MEWSEITVTQSTN